MLPCITELTCITRDVEAGECDLEGTVLRYRGPFWFVAGLLDCSRKLAGNSRRGTELLITLPFPYPHSCLCHCTSSFPEQPGWIILISEQVFPKLITISAICVCPHPLPLPTPLLSSPSLLIQGLPLIAPTISPLCKIQMLIYDICLSLSDLLHSV